MRVRESRLRDLGRLLVWYPFRWLLQAMPTPWGFAALELLGRTLGSIKAAEKSRKTLLSIGFDSDKPGSLADRQEDNLTLDYHANHLVDRLHIFFYPRFRKRPELVGRHVEIVGEDYLRASLESGKGVVLLQPHLGPVQLALFALARFDVPLHQVALQSDAGLSAVGRGVAFRQRQELEVLLPATLHPVDGYQRELFRVLQRGEVLVLSGDGAGGHGRYGEHREVRFLGERIQLPVGAFKLARLTGAALHPIFLERVQCGRYRLHVLPDLAPVDVPVTHDAFVRNFEDFLVRQPGLWHFWDEFPEGFR